MKVILIIISSLLAFTSYIVFIKAIITGKAKPHRTTRFVLLLITLLATAALISQGNRVAVWLSGVFAFNSIIIFLLSLKFGMGGWSMTDIICFIAAILGIIAWQITKNPIIALYFSILADFFGVIPTLIKTYRFPKTEVWIFYFLDVLAALFNLLASSKWNFYDVSYPLYIIFIDSIMVVLIIRPLSLTQIFTRINQ